jgi:hypothetical protein
MIRVKFWDKNAAIDKAMKHLGAYERDNAQRSESLELEIVPVVRSLIRQASSSVVATLSQTIVPNNFAA